MNLMKKCVPTMKNFRAFLTIFLGIMCGVILAPTVLIAGDEDWRPISPAEMALKESSVEKNADAEAIFWEVRINDSDTSGVAQNHYVRVKIFTERGRERFSKFDIPFVKGTKIKDVSARVIKTDGTIVELKKEDIFEREIIRAGGVKVKAKSFAVPNIEPGVIVEYRYRQVRGNGASAVGMALEFQRDIPVQNLSYYYKPYEGKKPIYSPYNLNGINFVKDKNGYFLAQNLNVPSFQEEPRMPPELTVKPWMRLQDVRQTYTATNFGIGIVTKDPAKLSQYWGAVSSQRAVYFQSMMKSKGDVKKVAAEVAGSAATPDEKLQKLYDYCQTNIKNLTFDTVMTPEQRMKISKNNQTLGDVLKNKSGESYEIDMLFGAMALTLDMDVRVAMTGDRSEMFFDPNTPDETLIHLAAIAVKVGDNYKFYNPGLIYLPAGSLIWYEENVYAMLINDKNYVWVQTPMTTAAKTLSKRTGKFKLLEDGTLAGTVRIEHNGHAGWTRKLSERDETPDKRAENVKEDVKRLYGGGAEVSAITVENVEDTVKPIIYSYQISIPNYAQKTGKRLFFQPNFFEYGTKPLFTANNRKHDIYFNYPWSEEDSITIEMPSGYTLDNGDSPAPVQDPQKIGSNVISMAVAADGKTLKYQRKFYFGDNNNILFPAQFYAPIKSMFEFFHKNDTHSLALKQNAPTATK